MTSLAACVVCHADRHGGITPLASGGREQTLEAVAAPCTPYKYSTVARPWEPRHEGTWPGTQTLHRASALPFPPWFNPSFWPAVSVIDCPHQPLKASKAICDRSAAHPPLLVLLFKRLAPGSLLTFCPRIFCVPIPRHRPLQPSAKSIRLSLCTNPPLPPKPYFKLTGSRLSGRSQRKKSREKKISEPH